MIGDRFNWWGGQDFSTCIIYYIIYNKINRIMITLTINSFIKCSWAMSQFHNFHSLLLHLFCIIIFIFYFHLGQKNMPVMICMIGQYQPSDIYQSGSSWLGETNIKYVVFVLLSV